MDGARKLRATTTLYARVIIKLKIIHKKLQSHLNNYLDGCDNVSLICLN